MTLIEQNNEMISAIENWLKQNDYKYIECNYVPEHLFCKYSKINVLLRTIFRLLPWRSKRMMPKNSNYPLTPQSLVAMLKAFSITKDKTVLRKLYDRTLSLSSPLAKNFALKQGIRIAINLYEDSSEAPTPLNTVWFGQFLLEDESDIISKQEKQDLLFSIADYLITELGYIDHKELGIYFYYGHNLKKEVYNASAIISSFLIKLGVKYKNSQYIELGNRGILYICNRQNEDGSWFYAASPERATIDCFHQSYILQSICSVKEKLPFNIDKVIERGISFYKSLFLEDKNYLHPIRYDKRFTPHNTWLFVKVDGRDVAEALIFFTKYYPDIKMVKQLMNYTYNKFFNKKRGYMYPEIFIYGKNRTPYIEFQSWFLYAFQIVKQYNKDCNE